MRKFRRATIFAAFLFATISTVTGAAHSEIRQFTNELGTWREGCNKDKCYLYFPLEVTAEPHSIFHVVHECTDNEKCVAAIAAAVKAFGGDPGTVIQYASYYNAAYPVLWTEGGDNINKFYLKSPEGFVACGLRWNFYSRRPNKATTAVSATLKKDLSEILFYTDLPKKEFSEGRSWAKIHYEIRYDRKEIGCRIQDNIEVIGYGYVYQNSNDLEKSAVSAFPIGEKGSEPLQ